MIQTVSRLIGSTTYQISQLPFSKARPMIVRLTRLLGVPLAAVAQKDAGSKEEAIAAGVARLADVLTDEDLEYVCAGFAAHTKVSVGEDKFVPLKDVLEVHFAGKYDELVGWLRACVEVNFDSFFAGLSSAGPRGTPPAA